MLVYLASYPRSGNSLLHRIISGAFWRLTAEVKVAPRSDLPLAQAKGWEISRPDPDLDDPPVSGALADWLIRYRRAVPGEPAHWGFRSMPQQLLSPEHRRQLADHEELFLLKTHHPPLDGYVPGERVVQVVRHPGPVLRSYFRLLQAQAAGSGGQAPSLEEVIEGQIPFGSWSAYHAAWEAARDELGPAALLFRYGDLVTDQPGARRRLSGFLGLAIRSEDPVRFELYRRKHAQLGVGGADEGLEDFYAPGQLERLNALHGQAAERLGL